MVEADELHEKLAQVFRLLSGDLLRYHRPTQALFAGDTGGCKVDVDLVLLIFGLAAMSHFALITPNWSYRGWARVIHINSLNDISTFR